MNTMTILEVSKELGLSERTVQRYCTSGFLPAKQVWIGHVHKYEIEVNEFLKWNSKHFRGLRRSSINKYNRITKDLTIGQVKEASEAWLDWCLTGKLTGKLIAPRTVHLYRYYFGLYLEKLGKRPPKPLISINNVREDLGGLPVESFSTKLNVYSALMSFSLSIDLVTLSIKSL